MLLTLREESFRVAGVNASTAQRWITVLLAHVKRRPLGNTRGFFDISFPYGALRQPIHRPLKLGAPAKKHIMALLAAPKALEIIQRNERGRQGKQRALLLKDLREEEKKRRIYDATDQLEMDPEIAAANIQVRTSAAHSLVIHLSHVGVSLGRLKVDCRFRRRLLFDSLPSVPIPGKR